MFYLLTLGAVLMVVLLWGLPKLQVKGLTAADPKDPRQSPKTGHR